MVSQGMAVSQQSYNVIFSVFSSNEEVNKQLMNDITEKLQIETKPFPKYLKKIYDIFTDRFEKAIEAYNN